MEERRTDPRILNLILAVMTYIDSKKIERNPFVRGFGETQDAYEYLVEAVGDCTDYFPELEEMLANISVSESDQKIK